MIDLLDKRLLPCLQKHRSLDPWCPKPVFWYQNRHVEKTQEQNARSLFLNLLYRRKDVVSHFFSLKNERATQSSKHPSAVFHRTINVTLRLFGLFVLTISRSSQKTFCLKVECRKEISSSRLVKWHNGCQQSKSGLAMRNTHRRYASIDIFHLTLQYCLDYLDTIRTNDRCGA